MIFLFFLEISIKTCAISSDCIRFVTVNVIIVIIVIQNSSYRQQRVEMADILKANFEPCCAARRMSRERSYVQ